jgi:hypothetical protein
MSVLLSFLLFYLWRKIVFKMNIRYSRRRCLLLKHLQQHHHHHHDIHVIKMNENCLSKHLKNINCFHIPINFISLRDQLKNPKFNRGKTINTRKNMPNDDFIEATIVKKSIFQNINLKCYMLFYMRNHFSISDKTPRINYILHFSFFYSQKNLPENSKGKSIF